MIRQGQGGKLATKTAIITGAGRGIGRAIAMALVSEGASVVLAARSESELQTVADEITNLGGRAMICPTDVTDEKQIGDLVDQATRRFGGLDILVNNAGIGEFGPLRETSTQAWDRIMTINARGPFLLCREALPWLTAAESKPAFIINIGSVVSVKGYPNQAAYSASKHALLGMTKALAKEVQDQGVRVHAVNPGGVETELVTRARPDLDVSVLMRPQEIADIVLFLVTRNGNAVIDQVDVRRDASTPFG